MPARKASKKKAVRKQTAKKAAKRKKGASKKAAKKGAWGGKRKGAGRPKGSGQGPSPDSRRNRVAIMLSDVEFKALTGRANKKKLPVSTLAYELVAGTLGRIKG